MIALVGEPGVGKSRLVDSFLHVTPSADWQLGRCGCLSYGTSTPWLPVIELIRRHFGIEDRDDRQRAGAKLEAGLAAIGGAMAAISTPLRALLDLPLEDPDWQALSPPQRRRRMIDAVKSLLFMASERTPLALLFEDLHWVDGETLVLLDSLVESLVHHRILLLITYRPEFQHAWGHRACYLQVRVDPLREAGARQLLTALLGSDPGLAALERQLIARTEGNPLLLEEAVSDLAERGVLAGEPGRYRLAGAADQLHLPQTVQAILAARIDRLAPEAKTTSSCVGSGARSALHR